MVAGLLAMLAGCGGGDGDEVPPNSSVQPLHRSASAEPCRLTEARYRHNVSGSPSPVR